MSTPLDHATALRLADAATLLLDTARDFVANSPRHGTGPDRTKEMLALAVQALIVGDHLPNNNPGIDTLPEGYTDRWEGVALGLGAAIGLVTDPGMQLASLMVMTDCMARGAKISAAAVRRATQ